MKAKVDDANWGVTPQSLQDWNLKIPKADLAITAKWTAEIFLTDSHGVMCCWNIAVRCHRIGWSALQRLISLRCRAAKERRSDGSGTQCTSLSHFETKSDRPSKKGKCIYIYTYTQYRHVEREASLAISLTQIVWIPGKPPGTHACIMLMLVLCSKQYFPCPWHKQVLKVSKN